MSAVVVPDLVSSVRDCRLEQRLRNDQNCVLQWDVTPEFNQPMRVCIGALQGAIISGGACLGGDVQSTTLCLSRLLRPFTDDRRRRRRPRVPSPDMATQRRQLQRRRRRLLQQLKRRRRRSSEPCRL